MRNLLLVAGALLLASPAFAFHIEEHVQITERAVRELQGCGLLPSSWTGTWTDDVAAADKAEDTDLFRKWTSYSHYYNPNHPLDMYRSDSSRTVTESVASIQGGAQDDGTVNQMIGRIVHHVQDSSVPAHAVPVAHSFDDGFETADASAYFAEALSPAACAQLHALEPMSALHDNAENTLASLNGKVNVVKNGKVESMTWLGAFWALGNGNEFGEYGELGNVFGMESFFPMTGGTAEMEANQFFLFKRARLEAAVLATEGVILWANKVRGM